MRIGEVARAAQASDVAFEVPERLAAVDCAPAQERCDARPVVAPVDALAVAVVEVAEERVLVSARDECTFAPDRGHAFVGEAEARDREAGTRARHRGGTMRVRISAESSPWVTSPFESET